MLNGVPIVLLDGQSDIQGTLTISIPNCQSSPSTFPFKATGTMSGSVTGDQATIQEIVTPDLSATLTIDCGAGPFQVPLTKFRQFGAQFTIQLSVGSSAQYVWPVGSGGASYILLSGPSTNSLATLQISGGSVLVQKPGVPDWETASNGDAINWGDGVQTTADGYATMKMSDGSILQFAPKSELSLHLFQSATSIWQEYGKVFYYFVHCPKPESESTPGNVPPECYYFRYGHEPSSIIFTTGGTQFALEVNQDGSANLLVFDGTVQVTDTVTSANLNVTSGQQIALPTQGGISTQELQQRVSLFDPNTVQKPWVSSPSFPLGSLIELIVFVGVPASILAVAAKRVLQRRRGLSPLDRPTFCTKCGAPLQGDVDFCTKCGSPVS